MKLSHIILIGFATTSACGLDLSLKTACEGPTDCLDDFACINFQCVEGSQSSSDTDGDGLTDFEEGQGWVSVIDEQGFGLAAGAELLTSRQVSSNPFVADTDGDGLNDQEEFIERSDPEREDTDGDGLTDLEEKQRYRTNLLSVDTDGDAKDPENNTLPLASLFDGAEVLALTSPTAADTDGDGKSDFEERDSAIRDPRVAEIPQARIDVVGELTVQMNITYSDEQTTEVTYGETFETTNSNRFSRSDMESTAITIAGSAGGEGFFDDLEFSKEGAVKFFGGKLLELGRAAGCELFNDDNVVFDSEDPNGFEQAVNGVVGFLGDVFGAIGDATGGGGGANPCAEPTPETTNTTSTTLTQESIRSATESFSNYRSDRKTRTESASTGTISVGISVENRGLSTFTLVNPSLTMMQWLPSPSPSAEVGAGGFRTLATLAPIDGGQLDENGNRTFTLSPDSAPIVLQVENREVNADFIKSFLARPSAVFFSPANFVLNDQEGVAFDFLSEETFGRTATLVIDDGVSEVIRKQVATNVERDENGELMGARMGTLFSEVLDIDYQVQSVEREINGAIVNVNELHAIGNLANNRALNRGDVDAGIAGDPEGLWVISVQREAQAAPELDFEEMRLLPGDEVRLIYVRDLDGDGVFKREEDLYGTSDDNPDSDGDGLTDFQELKSGWDVTISYDDGGTARDVTYRVTSNPNEADTDGDGTLDVDERSAATDPNNTDTDDDGREDRCDLLPTDLRDDTSNGLCDEEALVALIGTGSGFGGIISLDNGGGLSLGGEAVDLQPRFTQATWSPDGGHLYYSTGSNSGGLVHMDFDLSTLSMSLNPFPQPGLGSGLSAFEAVAMHPSGRVVYVADHEGDGDRIYAYTLDQATGQPTFADSTSDIFDVKHLEVGPLGRFMIASGSDRDIGIFDLSSDEALEGTLNTPEVISTGRTVLKAMFHPSGERIYALLPLVSGSGRELHVYDFDRDTMQASPIAGSPFAVEGTPFDFRIDPTGRFIYMQGTQLHLHRITPETGTVALVDIDGDPLNGITGYGTTFPRDTAFAPLGDVIYVLDDDALKSYGIADDGTLTSLATLGNGGRHLSILTMVP